MSDYIYDGTFEGLLSATSVAISGKDTPSNICKEANYQHSLFGVVIPITSDYQKAEELWNRLKEHTSNYSCKLIHYCFLSEIKGIEMDIYNYVKLALESPFNIETNFNDDRVLKLSKIQRKVSSDVHRIKMFVRFAKTKDDIYFSSVEPDYDTLQLAAPFFCNRFADQKWIIYDVKRKYGLFYDLESCDIITFTDSKIHPTTGKVSSDILTDEEDVYQELWRSYFKHINIKERKNIKLHRQSMPQRFWKHLTEKQ